MFDLLYKNGTVQPISLIINSCNLVKMQSSWVEFLPKLFEQLLMSSPIKNIDCSMHNLANKILKIFVYKYIPNCFTTSWMIAIFWNCPFATFALTLEFGSWNCPSWWMKTSVIILKEAIISNGPASWRHIGIANLEQMD